MLSYYQILIYTEVNVMKISKLSIALILAASMLTSCSGSDNSGSGASSAAPAEATTSAAESSSAADVQESSAGSENSESGSNVVKEEMYADLSNGMPDNFEASDGWTNGSMFNVYWRAANVTFENGAMQLIIKDGDENADGIPYSGGEFRSKDFYGYGRYEVSMKAIKNDGVVSSFFTYTGPSDNNPWDEIDIEILGKDTTKVQFNYYTDGKGQHEYLFDLGFDASEDFHTYAFEWHKDKIVWFVDGIEAHTATYKLPVTESKIMMNAWCGTGVDSWLNAFKADNLPLTAEYQWVKFTPFDE